MVWNLFVLLPACRRCWTSLAYLPGTFIHTQLPFEHWWFELQWLLQIPHENFIPSPRQAQEKQSSPRGLITWRDEWQGRKVLCLTRVWHKASSKTSAETSHSPVLPQRRTQEQFVVHFIEYSTFATLLYISSEKTSNLPVLHQESPLLLMQANSWAFLVPVLLLGPARTRFDLS